ncbi:MAG: SdrD B-like domain-containing protein [Saprospiraceae bacterium]
MINLTTTTDATGMYMFGNQTPGSTTLPPGTYKLTFVTPTGGYLPTNANDPQASEATDSDADPAMGGMTTFEVLTSGEYNPDYDAGYYIPASIGDYAWIDDNANGVQDSGEPGLEGVQVMLIGTDGQGNAVMLTTYTDVSGYYLFDNLAPGTYKLKFAVPAGTQYEMTGNDLGGDDAMDSDAIESMGGMTATTTLVSGEHDPSWDAGFYIPASLGDYVWIDDNANGVQDPGELPLAGVTVKLQDASGNPVTVDADGAAIVNQVTDANGFYQFTNLVPGVYKVMFVNPNPVKYTLTNPNEGTDDAVDSDPTAAMLMTQTTTLGSGDHDPTLDAGFFVKAKVGDFVWHDQDGDGIQDAGEPGINGVTVTLTGTDGFGNPVTLTTTTSGNGMYMFNDLVPGDYKITFGTPGGNYVPTSPNEGADDALDSDYGAMGMTDPFVLTSGDTILSFDAGFWQPAKIGNFVWNDLNWNGIQDAGEPGIGGATVVLSGTTGAGDVLNLTTTTDATGMYMFGNQTPGSTTLPPGTYKLTFVTPTGGYLPTNANDPQASEATDSDADPAMGGMTTFEVLTSGEYNPDYDAGFYIPASIGDYAWIDDNANGVQDSGEPGLEGVQVMLIGTDGQGNAVMLTTYTDVSGYYLFDNLAPGTYKLKFAVPAGTQYEMTGNDLGGDDAMDSDAIESMGGMTATTTLVSGEHDPSWDAGFYIPASLGDYVWIDDNANGVQDPGELPLAGVTVKLQDASGNPVTVDADGAAIMNQVTDANGFYQFTNLVPGVYKVMFVNPNPVKYTLTNPNEGTDDAVDSDPTAAMLMTQTTTLGSGDHDPTLDAGFFVKAKVGDFVWHDQDGDGIQDAGEPGINGVTVTLTGTDGFGNPVTLTTTTSGNGMYMFNDLVPGDYKITFGTPGGNYVPTSPNEGANDALDSDYGAMGMTDPFVLTSGDTILSFDAGFWQPAKIGNFVWNDLNWNGIQDAGEPGIGGAEVILSGTTGAGDVINMSTTTDATGMYMFGNQTPGSTTLPPGTYKLTFVTPTGGYLPTNANDPQASEATDSDADPAMGGMTTFEVLTSGEYNPDYDAGYYIPPRSATMFGKT